MNSTFSPELMKGQTVLVTGGGTGLGRDIAQVLAESGADLLLAARNTERLETAAAEIRESTKRSVAVHPVNIRERDTVEALAEYATTEFGKIDVLINNAGGQYPQAARAFSEKGWKAVIDTNLNGTWNMTQIFGNRMLDGDGGTITNIIAVVGRGFPGIAHTAAARAGVLELTRTLATEWGPTVRINCIAPGAIATEGFNSTYDPEIARLSSGVPLQRFGTRREIADAAVFISSPAASYITGEVLNVSGGQQNYGCNQAIFDEQFKDRE